MGLEELTVAAVVESRSVGKEGAGDDLSGDQRSSYSYVAEEGEESNDLRKFIEEEEKVREGREREKRNQILKKKKKSV